MPWVFCLGKYLFGTLCANTGYAFVAVNRVARKALSPEPVVSFFRCCKDQLIPIEEVSADLFHVLVRRNKNKIARIEMTFQTQSVVGFKVFITDSLVVGFTPLK